MKQLIAFANIKDSKHTYEEDFKVESKETAESDIKEVVQFFNDTLKPGESPRSFEGIVRFEEQDIHEPRDISVDEDYGYSSIYGDGY